MMARSTQLGGGWLGASFWSRQTPLDRIQAWPIAVQFPAAGAMRVW